MTVKVAHRNLLSSHSARAAYCCSIAALLIFFGCHKLQSANAEGDTRTISFHHVHTDEELTITYKVNGRYDEEALKKINYLLRDWRESEPTKMDPHLIDLLWEVHREVGAKEAIWIICGYRSPGTNSMLRRRSSGVAEFSQHTLGKAIDFYIPGVPLERLREVGLRAQRGGVGFYPTSGSPFVHMDTGSVRHWPRMPEAQLASVLAKGQLKYAVAQADTQQSAPSLFARLFGGGRNEAEDAKTAAAARRQAHSQAGRARGADGQAGGGCGSVGNARRKNGHSAVPAGQTRQDGDLPGRIRGLEARRQADAGLRVFRDRRHAGELRSRIRKIQAGASRPGGTDPGRVRKRIRDRHHQRARLLAGTAQRRCNRCAANRQHPRSGSSAQRRNVRPPAPIRRPRRAPLPGP